MSKHGPMGFNFAGHKARSEKIKPVVLEVPPKLVEVYEVVRVRAAASGVVRLDYADGTSKAVLACGLQPEPGNLVKFLRPLTARPGIENDLKYLDFAF